MCLTSTRADVAAYIEQVNETQREFSIRYGSVNPAVREFELSGDAAAAQLPRLRTAARTMTQLRASIERVDAPPEAEGLRSRLLVFLRHQEALANELVAVALYLPELGTVEQPLAAASARLRRGLVDAPVESQAVAVRRYARELRAIASSLDRLDPPPLLTPSHRAYVTQLRSYASSSEALQRGIDANDQVAVDAAVRRMQEAAASPPGTFRAQRAAIKAYNARVQRVSTLAVALEKERRRLEADL